MKDNICADEQLVASFVDLSTLELCLCIVDGFTEAFEQLQSDFDGAMLQLEAVFAGIQELAQRKPSNATDVQFRDMTLRWTRKIVNRLIELTRMDS